MMVEEHLPLVRLVAERIHYRLPPGVDLEALIHAGVLGLVHATQHMNDHHPVLFSSYVRYRVQAEIVSYLRSLDWVSHAIRTWGRQVANARKQFAEHHQREATVEELAAMLGVSTEEYRRSCQQGGEAVLLNLEELSLASDEEWQRARDEFTAYPSRDPLLLLHNTDTVDTVSSALQELTEQERIVISLSYYEELTPREIGEILHLPEAQVRQRLYHGILSLRRILQGNSRSTR